jgi:hypothetical protein
MHRHSIADVGEQLGRRSEEYRDVVTGGDRLTQHVAPSAPVAPKMMTRAISLLLHWIPRTDAGSPIVGEMVSDTYASFAALYGFSCSGKPGDW